MTEKYFNFTLEASETCGFSVTFEMIVFGDLDVEKVESILDNNINVLECFESYQDYVSGWNDDDEEKNFSIMRNVREEKDFSELVYYKGNKEGINMMDSFTDLSTGYEVKIYGQV